MTKNQTQPHPSADDHELLTIPEAAYLLRLEVATVRNWLAARKLTRVKPGGSFRDDGKASKGKILIRRSEIEALIAAGTVPARWELVVRKQPASVIPIRVVESS